MRSTRTPKAPSLGRRLTALPLVLAALFSACERQAPPPAPPPPPGPVPVPLGTPADRVAELCNRTDDFDLSHVGPPTELAGTPGVIVQVIPRKESRANTLGAMVSGNMIAKLRNTGTQPYPDWALDANGGESCWLVGWEGGNPGRFVSRFVSAADPSQDRTTGDMVIRFHQATHEVDSAHVRNGFPLRFGGPLGSTGQGVVHLASFFPLVRHASLARLALQLEDGHAWSTCITNGCCMAGY